MLPAGSLFCPDVHSAGPRHPALPERPARLLSSSFFLSPSPLSFMRVDTVPPFTQGSPPLVPCLALAGAQASLLINV